MESREIAHVQYFWVTVLAGWTGCPSRLRRVGGGQGGCTAQSKHRVAWL